MNNNNDKKPNLDNDLEFIKGNIIKRFTPQFNDGFYIVVKGKEQRKYSLKKFADLHLRNWESLIDSLSDVKDKLRTVHNAIFKYKSDLYEESNPAIRKSLKKNIKQLKNIKSYIEAVYPKSISPDELKIGRKGIRQIIIEKINAIDSKGWKYVFKSEQDFMLYTDLLTDFFENNNPKLPKSHIQLNKGCKTRLGPILGQIHTELITSGKLNKDIAFFDIVRMLDHFQNRTDSQIYKDLTRS